MLFNINHCVRVRLTDVGRTIYRERHEALNAFIASRGGHTTVATAPKEDADGWSTWQLWTLMREFGGEHMMMVSPPPFEMEIEVLGVALPNVN